MPENHVVKPLKYKSLLGFTERQLSEHHDVLYAGYVKKLNEIETKMPTADKAAANGTYSEIGELKREETFATNGITLHEAYFDGMGGKGGKATGALLIQIEKDFGSYDNWLADFKAAGMAARGWVVLAWNMKDGKLHTYSQDGHNVGSVWYCIPILIMDVYEHAYFIDYGVKRKDYVEAYFNNIDWQQCGVWFDKAAKMRFE
ncbi:superoxide dismutase [Candidatus Woesearchaeota archaeon]|nr:superoxide dismutase [Candidatus Woesearchaeota archaeon]